MGLDTICRTCLAKNFELVPLMEINFTNGQYPLPGTELLMSFTSVKITKSHLLSQRICADCLKFLKGVYDFKMQCERSELMLETIAHQMYFPNQAENLLDEKFDEKRFEFLVKSRSNKKMGNPLLTAVRFDSILEKVRQLQFSSYNPNVNSQDAAQTRIDVPIPPKIATLAPYSDHNYSCTEDERANLFTDDGRMLVIKSTLNNFEKPIVVLNPRKIERNQSKKNNLDTESWVMFTIRKKIEQKIHTREFDDDFFDSILQPNRIKLMQRGVYELDGRPYLNASLDPDAVNMTFEVHSDGTVSQQRGQIISQDANSSKEVSIAVVVPFDVTMDKTKCKGKDKLSDDFVNQIYQKNGNLIRFDESLNDFGDTPKKPFICPECNDTHENMDILVKHIISNHTKDRDCFICNSKDIRNIQTHCIRHLPSRLRCPHCNKGFIDYRSRKKHVNISKGATFQCIKCEQKFCINEDYTWHMRKHDVLESAPDQIKICCGVEILSGKEFRRHRIRYHINKDLYTCKICSKQFTSFAKFRDDKVRHRKEIKLVQCPQCPKICKNEGSLSVHIERMHVKSVEKKNKDDISQRRCEICFYVPRNAAALGTHRKSHGQTPIFQCDLCNRMFLKKSTMLEHRRAFHCNLRQFKCEFCNIAFKYRNNLITHTKSKSHKAITDKVGASYKMTKLTETSTNQGNNKES